MCRGVEFLESRIRAVVQVIKTTYTAGIISAGRTMGYGLQPCLKQVAVFSGFLLAQLLEANQEGIVHVSAQFN